MIPLRDDNPTRITPYVTWLLVAVNVIIYLMQATGGMYETRSGLAGPMAGWTMVPAEVTQGRDYGINGYTLQPFWLTIFTSMFMHGGIAHLLGNMVFLIIFGNNVEDALGHIKYLAFYVICGVAASVAQIFYSPNSVIPTLGASGAIAGVLGAYIVLYPRARVHTLVFLGILITTVELPAFILLGFWIVSQFFSQFTQALKTGMEGESGGVAYLAHIGGFIVGMILIKLFGARPTMPGGPYDDEYPGDGGPRYVVVDNRNRYPYR
jgi:membrane associated rhomboid family serine protease